MNKSENTRLDRIEEKIDKLAEAVISIARAEEKIHNLEEKTIAKIKNTKKITAILSKDIFKYDLFSLNEKLSLYLSEL